MYYYLHSPVCNFPGFLKRSKTKIQKIDPPYNPYKV